MTKNQFQTMKLVAVVGLAMLSSQAIVLRNYVLPIIGFALVVLVLLYFRGQVKEVMADERDYEISGKAARLAIQLFGWFSVVIMFVLYALRDVNPFYETSAQVLAYSTCFLLLVYSLTYKFYDRIAHLEKKGLYFALGLIGLVIATIIGMRLLSGEDDWLCQNGAWVKHGNPSSPAPTVPCSK
ncbi:MAG: DUF2178 domain-containing protein [Patescibacteria group bacterium]|nr:DUF2178 domain-containing protein [Patescibacteria group bacterium]